MELPFVQDCGKILLYITRESSMGKLLVSLSQLQESENYIEHFFKMVFCFLCFFCKNTCGEGLKQEMEISSFSFLWHRVLSSALFFSHIQLTFPLYFGYLSTTSWHLFTYGFCFLRTVACRCTCARFSLMAFFYLPFLFYSSF